MQELTGSLQRDALNLSQILAQSEISSKSAAIGELREAQSKLSAANRTNTMLLSMYLYLEEPGYVVTSYNGCYRLESFLDQEWLGRLTNLLTVSITVHGCPYEGSILYIVQREKMRVSQF